MQRSRSFRTEFPWHGKVLRRYSRLGKKKAFLSKNKASWWSNFSRREHVSLRALRRDVSSSLIPFGKRGTPRIFMSSVWTSFKSGCFLKNEEEVWSTQVPSEPSTESSHFWILTLSPNEFCSEMIVSKSVITVWGSPAKVPSSKYQTFNADDRREMRRWIHKEKQIGPRGSPCWIPSSDLITRPLKTKKLGLL